MKFSTFKKKRVVMAVDLMQERLNERSSNRFRLLTVA
jgi:hypothetical protein